MNRSGTESKVVALRPPAREGHLLARIIAAQNEIVQAAHDPGKVIEVVIRRAQELTRSGGAMVEILDVDEMVCLAASGTAAQQVGRRLEAGGSLSGLCVRERKVLWCDDAETDPRVDPDACRRIGLRSMLVVPLLHEDKAIGVLKVVSPYASAYGRADIRSMEMMATLVGAVLGHAIRYAGLVKEYEQRLEAERGEAAERSAVNARLDALLREGNIELVFQPVIRLSDGAVVGYESLCRFPGAERRSPARWFADAVKAGRALELELLAAGKALQALTRLPPATRLSINVSPETIVAEAFARLLSGHDISRLVIEITEHSDVEDYERLRVAVQRLQHRGAQLAIDDTGAGFASLRHVLHLAPDIIKLDISLTHGIEHDRRRQTLASAILTFAVGTQAVVVVEGIETREVLEMLKQLGVHYGQGYYLGRPAPMPEVFPTHIEI